MPSLIGEYVEAMIGSMLKNYVSIQPVNNNTVKVDVKPGFSNQIKKLIQKLKKQKVNEKKD